MIQTGRLCVKIAGRDAGKKCVVLSEAKNNRVLIDGETRRRMCNLSHLEPLPNLVAIGKEASHEDVKKVLEPLGIKVLETKAKSSAKKSKPIVLRRSKLASTASAPISSASKTPVPKVSGKASSTVQVPVKKADGSVQKKSRSKPKAQSAPVEAVLPDTPAAKTSV